MTASHEVKEFDFVAIFNESFGEVVTLDEFTVSLNGDIFGLFGIDCDEEIIDVQRFFELETFAVDFYAQFKHPFKN